ncbi:succinate dehydrogenase [bacterium]|nr:succinate dehydrogenase [bacterium]
MAAVASPRSVPRAFVWRRLHSLTGLWFLIFLLEHMFTNSQAAIFFGASIPWFVNSVNFLHHLPYLPLVETLLLGVPMALHAIWGVWYMFTAKSNAVGRGGKSPHLKYERNKAYSMQRITAWLILVGIIFHVAQMRFIMYPVKQHMSKHSEAFGRYKVDSNLYKVATQLGVTVYGSAAIDAEKQKLSSLKNKMSLVEKRKNDLGDAGVYDKEKEEIYQNIATLQDQEKLVAGLTHFHLAKDQVVIASKKSADLILLNVRQAFQSLWMCILYTVFVLAAVIHGCNGFWTFCITWGLLLSKKSQNSWVHFSYGLAFVMVALGSLAIWGSFFFNAGIHG